MLDSFHLNPGRLRFHRHSLKSETSCTANLQHLIKVMLNSFHLNHHKQLGYRLAKTTPLGTRLGLLVKKIQAKMEKRETILRKNCVILLSWHCLSFQCSCFAKLAGSHWRFVRTDNSQVSVGQICSGERERRFECHRCVNAGLARTSPEE